MARRSLPSQFSSYLRSERTRVLPSPPPPPLPPQPTLIFPSAEEASCLEGGGGGSKMTQDAEKKKRKFGGNRVWDQSIGKDSRDRERLGKSRMFVALAIEKQANSKFFIFLKVVL